MKHCINLSRMLSALILILVSCADMPGTQKWRIKKAATVYIKQDLKKGEHVRWGKIQRKVLKKVNNKTCTYAEVRYSISASDGNKYKTLYLLLSENCDSLYSVSEKCIF